MSDEEKKAIDVLKYVKNKTPFIFWYENKPYNREETINTILNLIEKQSKEIEELKNGVYDGENKVKDKIKEILGIEEDIDNEKLLILLQTIVDENARLEDIEDRKVQIEYNNVFNKGVKSVEDKIKAKIEEQDETKQYWTEEVKAILQALLLKE